MVGQRRPPDRRAWSAQTTSFDEDGEPTLQFLLSLIPLLLCHNNAQIFAREESPAAAAEHLGDKKAPVGKDDHESSGLQTPKRAANSSSDRLPSSSTCSTAAPNLATARGTSSSSQFTGR